jgi:putative SOS response-associated peptidase YedK
MPATDDVFAFAAVWDEWRPRSSGGAEASTPLRTFTILTTDANGAMKPLHDRMPVMLTTHGVDQWLDPKLVEPTQLTPLFAPFPDNELRTHRVGTWVNSPGHDDPKCIEECADLEIPELPQAPTRRARKPEEPGLFGAA